ncbi:MAG: PIN domain-containing protein [Actinomycetes bacterium]
MTLDVLLDTSMLVDDSFLDLDWPSGTQLAVSAIAFAELSAGPHASSDVLERARRTRVLARAKELFPAPLPFGIAEAETYGLVWAATAAAGRKPRPRLADLMIASTAITARLALATRNPADFRHLLDTDVFDFTLLTF